MKVYTIGHSNHSKETFLEMLKKVSITYVIDVRSMPGSRKFPQFDQDRMPVWLAENDIEYHHFPKLGGRRNKSKDIADNLNAGWNNQSFHNYADYTLSHSFQEGIKKLTTYATKDNTAYFCAESHPSKCHRLIISNWLAANGWEVEHLIKQQEEIEMIPHELGRWGAMPIIEEDKTVVYPE
ncbi:MAG TPA: DUF488 domain-containing protein [Pseudogracilibacillus sp.]|nr:DUF488 domain-containing protein [Pseudogracilibacillus sp.]